MSDQPRSCDVAVIGAGINGAGIARDAAARKSRIIHL
jgi:glycerol-3-phosphate dehydrogenase